MTHLSRAIEAGARAMWKNCQRAAERANIHPPLPDWDDETEGLRPDWRDNTAVCITAYEALLKAGGFVVVPKEPTQEMLEKAVLAVHAYSHSPDRGFHQYNGAWSDEAMRVYSARFEVGYRAMIVASQEP